MSCWKEPPCAAFFVYICVSLKLEPLVSDPTPNPQPIPLSGPPILPVPANLFAARYFELEEKLLRLRPNESLDLTRKAYVFATEKHEGQLRKSGEAYMSHPLEVAHILADMQMDSVCVQTGLLHDVVEDCGVSIDQIKADYGDAVAGCVDGVTKLAKIKVYSREDRQAESVRKMLLAMVKDIRVVIVKLADRLHNMKTLGALPVEKQQRIAQETLEIYAPIAHRLGMGKIRGELEDLGFEYLEPGAFADIRHSIESRRVSSEEVLVQIRDTVKLKLSRENIPARVEGRVKRPYSVFQKLRKQKISIDQVYDLLAIRIITDSVKNCYAALGIIHNEWIPIPGRIKDFIAVPRPNLYQSLHTSVMGPNGVAFEVQIRTEEMHRIAEEGIAAHWKYKEGKRGQQQDERQIAWLRQLVEWQQDVRDPGEFMSNLKVELYPEEVYAFSPGGRVVVLPKDASPVDFAYAIHSDVGNSCVGSKVNGRIVPLKYALKNGDVVEILTQNNHLPSKDWLGFVKTSRARNKIRHVINTTERVKAIEIGEKQLEREARRLGVQMRKIAKEDLERVANEYGVAKIEDLYASLGYGKFSARQILTKLAPDQVEAEVVEPTRAPSQVAPSAEDKDLVVRVKGVEDVLVYLAKCCNPIRGESIVGYISRGKGIAVHSLNCPNVQNLMYEVERKIEVEWHRGASETFIVKIRVFTDDRPGILNQLTSILLHESSNIRSLEAQGDEDRDGEGAIVSMTVEVKEKKQLERVVTAIRRIGGVRDVERMK